MVQRQNIFLHLVSPSINKCPHPRHRPPGNLWPLAHRLLLVLRTAACHDCLDARIPRPLRRGVVAAVVLDEEGAESGQGHHGDGDAGFDPLPVEFPDYVDSFGVAVVEARDSDDGYDDHDEREAK